MRLVVKLLQICYSALMLHDYLLFDHRFYVSGYFMPIKMQHVVKHYCAYKKYFSFSIKSQS